MSPQSVPAEAQSSDAAVKGIIGLALDEAIHTLYPHLAPAEVASFRQHYADVYVALDQQPSPLFDGVVESLDAFRAEGYRLAVATGKARRGLDRVLKANGWERFFDITRAADETRGKPHPLMLEEILGHCGVEPSRALMVGDSAFDLQMASNLRHAFGGGWLWCHVAAGAGRVWPAGMHRSLFPVARVAGWFRNSTSKVGKHGRRMESS